MLLEFKGEHPNDEGLCGTQQKRSVAAVFLLVIILTGLIFAVFYQLRINEHLRNVDLEYDNAFYFGILADIHLDQDQNKTHCRNGDSAEGEWIVHYPNDFGAKFCDSSLSLLNVTISELKRVESETGRFEFIIILGDLVGHWIEGTERSLETVNKVLEVIQAYFPSTPLYIVLGNHDLTTVHSGISKNIDQWYNNVYKSFISGFHQANSKLGSAAETFNEYGVYRIEHSSSLWVISLNTNPFYNRLNATIDTTNSQFDWLEKELQHAESLKSVSVLLMGHIAPEIEYLDLRRWDSNKNMTWKSHCITRFNDIVSRYSSIIKLSFFAHQHTDSWYVGKGTNGGYIQHFLMPPVATVSRGHPSFSVGIANEDWGLLDLLFYHSPVQLFTWDDKPPKFHFQYSFKQQSFHYDEKYLPIDGPLLEKLTNKIIDFDDGLQTFTARLMNTYQYRYKPHVSPYQMFCLLTENTSQGLEHCLKKYFF